MHVARGSIIIAKVFKASGYYKHIINEILTVVDAQAGIKIPDNELRFL